MQDSSTGMLQLKGKEQPVKLQTDDTTDLQHDSDIMLCYALL